jgi:hypothetical protein
MTLKTIAHELVSVVRAEHQRRLGQARTGSSPLAQVPVPPDRQESAIQLVMQQAELFASEVAA